MCVALGPEDGVGNPHAPSHRHLREHSGPDAELESGLGGM